MVVWEGLDVVVCDGLEVVVCDGLEVVDALVLEVGLDVVVAGESQGSSRTWLLDIVTDPVVARAAPWMEAPVPSVMLAKAMIVPSKWAPVSSVAELVTCQKMLQAWAPCTSTTMLLALRSRVDPDWKMNTALGSFCPSRVNVPVKAIESGALSSV